MHSGLHIDDALTELVEGVGDLDSLLGLWWSLISLLMVVLIICAILKIKFFGGAYVCYFK